MSFLDALKQDALAVLHATANALHAQLANTLSQAGHNVSEADHVDTLVSVAQAAATGSANAAVAVTTAPNYADAALATFNQSLMATLVQFAQQHLPAKFQGIAADVASTVSTATAPGVNVATIVDGGLKVAETIIDAVVPGAAPIAAIVEPLVESVVGAVMPAVDAAPSSTEPVTAAAYNPIADGPVSAANTQGV